MAKTVYIFGAGASRAVGLPMQSELLKYIFTLKRPKDNTANTFISEPEPKDDLILDLVTSYDTFEKNRMQLVKFICSNFISSDLVENYVTALSKIDEFLKPSEGNTKFKSNVIFKTDDELEEFYELYNFIKTTKVSLEDIFTILDKASMLKQYFCTYSSEEILEIKASINNCIIYALENAIQNVGDHSLYNSIAEYFIDERLADIDDPSVSIISTNWDTLLDYYLYKYCQEYNSGNDKEAFVDYCCDNYGFNSKLPLRQKKSSNAIGIKLMKLHGSINWLICSNCGRLFTDYNNNISLLALGSENEPAECTFCNSQNKKYTLRSFVVTPTFIKTFDNIHVQTIWHNAYLDLCKASKIVFIGYSFPDADFEFRYILKKAINPNAEIEIVLRNSSNPDFYTSSLSVLKNPELEEQVLKKLNLPYYRYENFFVKNPINPFYDGIEGYFK